MKNWSMCSFLFIIFREVLKVFAVIAIICSFHFIRNPDIGMIWSINAFRNDLFDGYKTGEGTPPEIMSQFPLVEALIEAAGFIPDIGWVN